MVRFSMPTVNHLKNSLLRHLPRKRSSSEKGKKRIPYVVAVLASVLICTYMELFFSGLGFYTFLQRPFPHIFTIDIRFTLIGIPVFTMAAIYALTIISKKSLRLFFILIISFIAMLAEIISEHLGLLAHSLSWSHAYSFFGYMVFTLVLWGLYRWIERYIS
ncbi:CBO0543 family protein [Bacillus sp. Marseille-Q3570]|uniref:CBO0543 family protein n=1 Tax=Bacillus sp. Marseille-Q3570 TaxID=2963522 RepID=UPI0028DC55EB|nr:CBO0543 family protein [Bacillus sp. Marseille-Q3570]